MTTPSIRRQLRNVDALYMPRPLTSTDPAVLQSVRGGDCVPLDPGRANLIGRAEHSDLLIRDPLASRVHAMIYWDGRRWFIVDCSSNGTFVNGKRIQRQALSESDVIRVHDGAEWLFTYSSQEGAVAEEAGHETTRVGGHSRIAAATGDWLILGSSSSTSALRNQVARIADQSSPVLIRGEMGVGKRHTARAIHMSGVRRFLPFLTVNCREAGPEEIRHLARLVREPSPASSSSPAAGTLLLDDVTRLSPDAQITVLSLLEENSGIIRMGEAPEVAPRYVAIATADPEQLVERGEFNSELLTKLSLVQMLIDPLRHRPQDIPELASVFLRQAVDRLHLPPRQFSEQALRMLAEYHWPANVLELKNTVERAVMLSQSDSLVPADLAGGIGQILSQTSMYQGMSLEEVERLHIQDTLQAMAWKKSHVATVLGIERSTLDRKIKRYDLRRGEL